MKRAARAFLSARRGVSALEFSLVVPILLLMLVGVFDVSKVMIISAQVDNASRLIPLSASTVATSASNAGASQATSLTSAQAQQAMSMIYAEFPWLRSGVETSTASVTLSSVAFFPIAGCAPSSGTNCYTATVMWSMAYVSPMHASAAFGTPVLRPCTALIQVAPGAALPKGQTTLTTLPTANITLPDNILVADVAYKYVPFFRGRFLPTIQLLSTGMWSDRNANATNNATQYTTLVPDGTTSAYCINSAPPS